jgi:hypothetical protein
MRVITPRRLAVCAALITGLLEPAPALAAAGSYGGGALTRAAPLVSVRVADTGPSIQVAGEAIATCAGGTSVDERLIVRTSVSGGVFTGVATRTYRVSSVETRLVRMAASGAVADGIAHGALRLAVLVRRRGRPPVSCDSHNQSWEARAVPVAVGTPGRPAPGAGYYGATTQPGRYLPYPVALKVSASGTQVDFAIYRLRRRCHGAVSDEVANNSPPAAIRPDGSFSVTQRYSQRFTDSIEEFTFVFAGRFGAGGAGGSLRGSSVLRDLRTHKVIGRCDSGPLAWTAAR